MHQVLNRALLLSSLAAERLRAIAQGMTGASIDAKCMLGSGVRFEMPETVHLGRRVKLESMVWLKSTSPAARIEIGEFSFLGRNCIVNAIQRVSIGRKCMIAPDVFITDHNHRISRHEAIMEQGCESTPVSINDDVWIGAKAVILPGVSIERGAVIGAGAVVTKSVSSFEIWAGVPARKIGERQ